MITLLELQKQIEKFIAENPEAANLPVGYTDYAGIYTSEAQYAELRESNAIQVNGIQNRKLVLLSLD